MDLDVDDEPLLLLQASEASSVDDSMNEYPPGQSLHLKCRASVLGVLTNVSALVVTLHSPDGSTMVDAAPVNDSVGLYHSDQALPLGAAPGLWAVRWQATGGAPAQNGRAQTYFRVDPSSF